ncbi:hypothetical protein BK026_12020 [Alteromonas sp. V450]|uniref:rhamnosyltransferase WsaF family glycosyltransferase n=1 Tax=Alteromonas sp. V450 TaxID=1912139 RepID=UPI00091EB2FF|nr:rhamnan synthesis F family protein [Alteromonas sp. V450]OJF69454.1 hypothetical protein BK026_12020 [Alteromonas sp. V450]
MPLDNCKNIQHFFNKSWYEEKYGVSKESDFFDFGWKSLNNPSEDFRTKEFIQALEESGVASEVDPLTYLGEMKFYNAFKAKSFESLVEQVRFISSLSQYCYLKLIVDEDWYLGRHQDVYQNGFHPLYHFYFYGVEEGRPSHNEIELSDVFDFDNAEELKKLILQPLDRASYERFIRQLYAKSETFLKAHHPDTKLKPSIFDPKWYLSTYSDVRESGIDPFFHFVNFGWKENRDPSALFNTEIYLNSEFGFREKLLETDQDPLQHYIQVGHTEEREIFNNQNYVGYTRYFCSTEPLIFTKSDFSCDEFINQSAVFIHCFYPEVADELIQSCLAKKLNIYVSFVHGTEYQYLIEKYPSINWKVFQNHGRDILPFFEGFKQEILSYKYVLHLHTKKSLHYGMQRSDWLQYNVNSLLGNLKLVHESLLDERTAIVFPEPPNFVKSVMNWGGNFERVKVLLSSLDIEIDYWDKLDFPAGSMFWMDTDKLRGFLSQTYSKYLFESEKGQIDGTLAHAIERAFGVFALKCGFNLLPIRDENDKNFDFSTQPIAVPYSVEKTKEYSPNYNLALRSYYPELTPFSFAASDNRANRLNLLIPTLDPQHIFGGISTALKFFYQLAECLGYETRIISTDSISTNNISSNYPLYSNYPLDFCDDNDPHHIISAVPREKGSLIVRKNDIFVGTAWWTVNHLDQINAFQQQEYCHSPDHIYLVQDYEPHFYGWSSKSELADATYLNDYIKVFNTQLLKDYFELRGKLTGTSFVLRPSLNNAIKENLIANNGKSKQKQICFYGRPSAERNCIEIIFEALSIVKSQIGDEYSEWRFISIGEEYHSDLAKSLNVAVFGKLSLKDYAALLSESAIGISLMVSPHPSYPPFEMAAAGMSVYTNCYDNKIDLADANIVVGSSSPEEIAAFLINKIAAFKQSSYTYKFSDEAYGEGLDLAQILQSIKRVID